MRTAIGEYIHLRRSRYIKYGIGRSETRGLSFTQSYNQAKNELLAFIGSTRTSLNLVELEKYFNMVKNRIGKNSSNIQTVGWGTDSLDDFFIQSVNAHFETKSRQIDFQNLDVNSLGSLLAKEKMNYNKNRQAKNPYFQASTFENFRTKLSKSIQLINQSQSVLSTQQGQQILLELQGIQNTVAQLMQSINQNGMVHIPYQKGANLIDQYNTLISAYSLPSKKELGDLGEFFAMYAALRASQKSQKEIKKLLTDFIKAPTSAHRTQTAYDLSGLISPEQLDKGFQNFTMQTNDGRRNLFVTVNGSQDTIDIKTDFNDGNALYASVKNVYNLNQPIKILSGAPITALFNLVNSDFVNHYMNMLSFNGFQTSLKQANEIFEKATAVRGLTGARQSSFTGLQPLANALIINQRQNNGKVKIISISQLLNQILRSKNELNQYLDINLSNAPSFDKIKIKNNTAVGNWKNNPNYVEAGQRIANIFSEIHNIKIMASLIS